MVHLVDLLRLRTQLLAARKLALQVLFPRFSVQPVHTRNLQQVLLFSDLNGRKMITTQIR